MLEQESVRAKGELHPLESLPQGTGSQSRGLAVFVRGILDEEYEIGCERMRDRLVIGSNHPRKYEVEALGQSLGGEEGGRPSVNASAGTESHAEQDSSPSRLMPSDKSRQ